MPANFTSDPTKGAGFGIITVEQITCTEAPSFALYRASDGLCLNAEGSWQNSEVYLTPNAWDNDSNSLRLSVDASIVDNLDALDTYKLLIKDGASTLKPQPLVVEDIVYSSLHGGQGIGSAAKPAPAVAPEPEPIPEPLPEPTPAPIAPPIEEPLPEMQPEPKKSLLPIVIAVVIILALIGAGLWWYLQNNTAEPKTPSQKTEQEAQTKEPAKQKDLAKDEANEKTEEKPKEEPKAEQAPQTPKLSPMQQVRVFLQKDNSGTASLELATSLQSELGQNADANSLDAVFLLLEDAAQKNEAKAMLQLAKYYDPSDNAPKGSILADANEAYTWYKKALAAGEANAAKHLDLLQTWLKDAASKGDNSAQQLLNQWK